MLQYVLKGSSTILNKQLPHTIAIIMQSAAAHMMSDVARLGAIVITVVLGGCAALPPPCQPPAQTMMNADMIFGRNIGKRPVVSDAAFAQFIATDITPHFPDGLTVLDAHGQWRDRSGVLLHERSKVVLITSRDDAQKRADLIEIADAYKRKFRQQSVLTTVRTACVSF